MTQISNKENSSNRLSIEEKVLDLMGFWESYKENCPPPLSKSRSINKNLEKLRSLKKTSSTKQDQSSPRLVFPKKLSIKRKTSVLITGELLEKFEKCRSDLHNDLKHKKKTVLRSRDWNRDRSAKK
jgi:hypothetical protein